MKHVTRGSLLLITTLSILVLPAVAVIPSGAFAFTFTTIDVPGATLTNAIGINAHGQIVGAFTDAGGAFHSFLLDEGTFTTIDPPGATGGTEAGGINAHGQIVGEFSDASGQHGFLLDEGTFTTIDVPGATTTLAVTINNRGQIVGFYDVSGTEHGFLAEP
jgi:probable HAF family extracellular repeat protein